MVDTAMPLSTTALKPSNIPAEDVIIAAGRQLIDTTATWKRGKTYFKDVNTLSAIEQGSNWYCRVSEHPPEQGSFDQFWDNLAKDKATHEKEFIPMIQKVTRVKEISPTAQIWTLYYKFPFPLSNRVFTVLQVAHREETAPYSGLIVSLPIDLSSKEDEELQKLEEKGIHGYYVSVERLTQLENGNVEWRMATSSEMGGLMPRSIVNLGMPKSIAEDVPHFLHWLKNV